MCDCISRTNQNLIKQGLKLKTRIAVSMITGQDTEDLVLETVAIRSGVIARPVLMRFCPICGVELPKAPSAPESTSR